MKTRRHAKILEIINNNAVETQEDLQDHLRRAGFQVTQATVSRDITEIGLRDQELDETAPNGELLRPHIVFFGEAVPMFEKAKEIVQQADLLIVVGTSLAVYPAASLVGWVKNNDVPIYVVDPSVPKIPFLRNRIFHKKERAALGLPKLVAQLKEFAEINKKGF